MPRCNNWPATLNEQIELAHKTPFAWGSHDCCLWPADVALALTGRDPAAAYRGKYSTGREAANFWRERGTDMMELVADGCDSVQFDPQAPCFAQRGDIVVAKQGNHHIAGVCVGKDFAAVSKCGLVFKPMADAVMAWRVA